MANAHTLKPTGRASSRWTFDSDGAGDAGAHGSAAAILGVAADGNIAGGNIQWQHRPEGDDKWFNVGTLVTDPKAAIQHILPLPAGDVRPVLADTTSTPALVCVKS